MREHFEGAKTDSADSIDFIQASIDQLHALRPRNDEKSLAKKRHIIETLRNSNKVRFVAPDIEYEGSDPKRIPIELNHMENEILSSILLQDPHTEKVRGRSVADSTAKSAIALESPTTRAATDLFRAYPAALKTSHGADGSVVSLRDVTSELLNKLTPERYAHMVRIWLNDTSLRKYISVDGQEFIFARDEQELDLARKATRGVDIGDPSIMPHLPPDWQREIARVQTQQKRA